MKTVYFVRHGESEGNAAGQFNAPDMPLSAKGRAQAEEIAKRAVRLPIEVIIASPLPRALATAEAIQQKTTKPLSQSDYFIERRLSSELLGGRRDDPEIRKAFIEMNARFGESGFRYGNGEGFDDLRSRALDGLRYLEERPETNILVVTHGFFLGIIAAVVLLGNDLTGEECLDILRSLSVVENTSVSVLTYTDSDMIERDGLPRRGWRLKVWNDHAHLG